MAEINMEKHGLFGNVMTPEAMAAKTDNFNKLMNRCWYGVAGTIFPEGMESFWEINWWDGAAREGKTIFSNQTITKTKGQWDVSPLWTGNIVDGKLSMNVRMKMPCFGFSFKAMTIPYAFLNFPENDSFSGFWVVGASAMGKPIIMIFCLDPHVSAEKVDAEIQRLETEHGIRCKDKIRKIAYDPEYKPGDTGEFAFNKDGEPATIDHSKNKNAHQVISKPYPPQESVTDQMASGAAWTRTPPLTRRLVRCSVSSWKSMGVPFSYSTSPPDRTLSPTAGKTRHEGPLSLEVVRSRACCNTRSCTSRGGSRSSGYPCAVFPSRSIRVYNDRASVWHISATGPVHT